MNTVASSISALALLAIGAGTAFAQGMPTSQPTLLTIVREDVKLGRAAEHSRFEAGWPAAFEKAKSPDYYLAFVSMTGLVASAPEVDPASIQQKLNKQLAEQFANPGVRRPVTPPPTVVLMVLKPF